MKVLQVINDLKTGGAEKLVTEIVPMFNAKGITTDVLLLNGNHTPFYKDLEKKGCTIHSLSAGSIYNPLLAFKIIPHLKKYDVVHVHLFPSQYWVALAKMLSFSKVKLVYTEHNTSSRRMRKPWFKAIDPLFYRPFSKIICIAEAVEQNVKKHLKISDKKLELIYNGVDIQKYAITGSYSKQDFFTNATADTKILIQVSSFQGAKDHPTLLRALALLPTNVKLLLAGDGFRKEECITLAQELGIENRVAFLGIRMDVPQLLKTADIVVLSSQYEGLSLSSIEGMAAGRPFIASDVPGLSNIVGRAGLLFPYKNHEALAAHIQELINNPDYYATVAQKCTVRATEYDIPVMISKHIALYKNLMR